MLKDHLLWRLPRVPEPHWTRDIPFATVPGTDRQLIADIWEPADGVERSGIVVVYLYGGSWHFFDKDVLTRPFFHQLAARGHVIMDAAHRSCPETDITGMVGDVHRAVAWIKTNARQYGIDPHQVVLMGGSSGSHISLLAGFASDDPHFKPESDGHCFILRNSRDADLVPPVEGSGTSRWITAGFTGSAKAGTWQGW
jgi:acetyl esterase/lipase